MRVGVGGGVQQDLGAVRRPRAQRHDVAGEHLTPAPAAGDHHPGDRPPARAGLQPGHLGPGQQGDIRPGPAPGAPRSLPRRTWRAPGTGTHHTRYTGCKYWPAGPPHPKGSRTARGTAGTRPSPGPRRSPRSAARATPPATDTALPVPLGRVLTAVAVHLVQLLRLRIPRLEIVIRQRPRRGHPIHMPQFPEIPRPQPVQRRPVQLRRPADEIMHLRLERAPVPVEPGVLADVLPLHEHRLRIPVIQSPAAGNPPAPATRSASPTPPAHTPASPHRPQSR